jgi:hypothetical protein
MNRLRLRCHLPTVLWMKKRGKKTCCMEYDLFWLGDHHVAVHKYAWNTLVNAGQNGCAWQIWSGARVVYIRTQTHCDVWYEMTCN